MADLKALFYVVQSGDNLTQIGWKVGIPYWRIVQANPGLGDAIELRHQSGRGQIFTCVLRGAEVFDISLCNPPFHASAGDAARGSRRKARNLAKSDATPVASPNFGGRHSANSSRAAIVWSTGSIHWSGLRSSRCSTARGCCSWIDG